METAITTHTNNQYEPGEGLVVRPAEKALSLFASWRMVLVSGALFGLFAIVFFATSAPFSIPTVEEACAAKPLDVRPYSSADEVAAFLDGCGERGRDAYRNLQIADLFYPAVSGLFFASALAVAIEHLFPRRPNLRGLAVVALAGAGFDYLENVFAWRALAAYPAQVASNDLLGLASAAKNGVSWSAGVMLLAALVALLVRALRRRTLSSTWFQSLASQ